MSEEGQGAASHAKQAAAEGAALPPPPDEAALLDVSTAVSQTNLNQVGSGGVVPASEGKWRCETCTYDNYQQSKKCTMCRASKPVLGEDIFRLQDGASALPASPPSPPPHTPPHTPTNLAGAEGVTERLKPLRISSPPGGPGGPHSSACTINKWPCSTCTYENWPKSLKCAMCGAPAPATAKPQIGANETCGAAAVEPEPRRSKRPQPAADWIWLQACLGVVEGCPRRVDAYLSCGGDPARALTAQEVALLDRASAFDAGHTLVHLAIRFQQQEILTTLLSRISGGGPGLKRSPSYIAPDLAAAIRRQLAAAVRYKKGGFPCRYVSEFNTFTLPNGIESLPSYVRAQLVSELVDREAQAACEGNTRLHALWNRTAGDCLPDAVCQAALGVADRDNALRGALHETLEQAARALYPRWAAWERATAARLHYAPDEAQLRAEWGRLVAAAAAPGTPLRQLHVWVLAHVMRRPLLVYGEDVVRSFRGEPLGYARFQGIYLPLLWDPAFCSKSPLCLGYTRGHFSALVPMEPPQHAYICRERQDESRDVTFLPLTDPDGKLLPVHFLDCEEECEAEREVRRWVRVAPARGGALACVQSAPPRPLLQAQMLEEWLNHYRRLAQQTRGPFPPRLAAAAPDYCSEPDTDEE